MAFDGFYMHHMNSELQTHLLNGRVTKIHQPNAFELVFTIRSQQTNYRLLFNISANSCRYHLTTTEFINPETPTNFCMVLRKYLDGAILQAIQQVQNDRLTTFIFRHFNELGDLETLHLSVEIMGKHSNICLINPQTNKIIDCMKHVSPAKNSYRTLLPNALYMLPPSQQKQPFFTLSTSHYITALQTQTLDSLPFGDSLAIICHGFSKRMCHYLNDYQQQNNLTHETCFSALQTMATKPTVTENSFFAIQLVDNAQTFETLSASLDHYYATKAQKERVVQAFQHIHQKVTQALHKNNQKLMKLTEELHAAQHADDFRIKGELLTAYQHLVERGMTTVTVENYYDNQQPLTIPLKIEKNAVQNAKMYFKKYQKLKQSTAFLTQQLQLTTEEIDYLDSVLVQLEHATLLDLELLTLELQKTGYIKQKQSKQTRKVVKHPPITYYAPDGTRILVGRNNLQNDELTLKLAHKTDIWLHTKNIPGSHVILKTDQPSQETLQIGAMIAAYHSKFQRSANVPVDYVSIARIKKPNGAKPGFVIYDGQKTLTVTPDEHYIQTLRKEH